MALVTKGFTFSAGEVIIASEHNTNFDTLYSEINGSLSNVNISGSAAIVATKLNLATIAQAITFTGNNTFAGTTIADLGTVTTADIDGGTLDGVQIGGTTATGELIVNDSSDGANGLGSQGTSGQVLLSGGAGANPTWGDFTSGIEVFTADGTFTTNSSTTEILISMVGGGGAGGGGDNTGGNASTGGGGGSGAYVIDRLVTVTASTAYTLQVGTGGVGASASNGGVGEDTIFDTGGLAITCDGGLGGIKAVSDGSGALGGEGGAGTGTTAYNTSTSDESQTADDYLIPPGGDGHRGHNANPSTYSGAGGSSPFGKGADGRATNGTGNTPDAGEYGAGGSGGMRSSGNASTGGNGSDGIIIIKY